MGLTEKTLELNVTHELLLLGQGIGDVFWPVGTATPVIAPRPGPPIYAAGLTLRQEARRGWDVSLELPAVGATPPRVVFLQFKLGERRSSSRKRGSAFRWTPHVVFGINNNTLLNQHGRLRATAAALGNAGAALYALPLVTREREARQHAGRLAGMTAFVRTSAIDAVANPAITNGHKRAIAISLSHPLVGEVRSVPSSLPSEDWGADLLGQVAAVRLHREMTAWGAAFRRADLATLADDEALGGRIAIGVARYLAYFFERPAAEALALLDLPPAATAPAERAPDPAPEAVSRPAAEDADPAEDASALRKRAAPIGPEAEYLDLGPDQRRARLAIVAGYVRKLVGALASGEWIARVPEPPGCDLLIQVPEPLGARLAREEGEGSGPTRLSYLVI